MKDVYINLTREIHPLSLVILLALDLVWMCFEGLSLGILLIPPAVLMIFLACFMGVVFTQRFLKGDDWKSAAIKGAAFGFIAAIPTSFVGWIFGAIWGGLFLRYRTDKEVILLGRLTENWRELEKSLRSMAPAEMQRNGIDDVIRYLRATGKISSAEETELQELRYFRNISTHRNTPEEIEDVVARVTRLRQKYDRRIYRR